MLVKTTVHRVSVSGLAHVPATEGEGEGTIGLEGRRNVTTGSVGWEEHIGEESITRFSTRR